MAVKVGNSWVSEAAYAYAKEKQASPKAGESMLSQLSEKYQDTNFTTNTEPFSGKGFNNIGIAPNILSEMEKDPEKQLEYEALIYDCVSLQKSLSKEGGLQSFGFIIDQNGGLRSWSISRVSDGKKQNLFQTSLPKHDRQSWMSRILSGKKSAQNTVKNRKSTSVLDLRA